MKRKNGKQRVIKSKGERLNWTPIENTEKVNLKNINIKGEKVSSDVIKRAKKFVDKNRDLLIP